MERRYNYIVTKGGACLTGFTYMWEAERYARMVGGKVEENHYEMMKEC